MEIIDIDRFTVVAYEFTDPDLICREQHEAAVKLLKNVLYDCYGIRYEEKTLLEGKHGKPYFEDKSVCFNITHTKGLVACMICGNSETGIDAEPVRSGREKTVRKFMTQKEREHFEALQEPEKTEYLFRIWTLKEALAKAYGTGIDADFAKPEFEVGQSVSGSDNGFWYYQWKLSDRGQDYILSAALEK